MSSIESKGENEFNMMKQTLLENLKNPKRKKMSKYQPQ